MDLLFAAIAAVKNKEEDGESTQSKVRLYDPKKTHAVYQRVKARRVASLREQVKRIWELFPADGIKRLCSSSMEDSNHNYGLHQSNLGFDTVPRSNSEGRINGTRTMGLRYENEHLCRYSTRQFRYLFDVRASVHSHGALRIGLYITPQFFIQPYQSHTVCTSLLNFISNCTSHTIITKNNSSNNYQTVQ